MNNEVLNLILSEGATIVCFADKIVNIVVERDLLDMQLKGNAIVTVESWLDENSLDLAEHKTEAVLISKKRKREVSEFRVGNFKVVTGVCVQIDR